MDNEVAMRLVPFEVQPIDNPKNMDLLIILLKQKKGSIALIQTEARVTGEFLKGVDANIANEALAMQILKGVETIVKLANQ